MSNLLGLGSYFGVNQFPKVSEKQQSGWFGSSQGEEKKKKKKRKSGNRQHEKMGAQIKVWTGAGSNAYIYQKSEATVAADPLGHFVLPLQRGCVWGSHRVDLRQSYLVRRGQ